MPHYTKASHETRDRETRASAEVIVPLVLERMPVESVIDVGCGVGTWLSVFKALGVDEIRGLDGDWVDKHYLVIPDESFTSCDLTQPIGPDRTFDLAVSLEVAEHLPAECAETFVGSLARLAPVILFSAAAPSGVNPLHLNEQWPDYWVDRFEKQGYQVVDAIRSQVWQDERVLWWYAQNILLFVRRDRSADYPRLKEESERTDLSRLSIVHPERHHQARQLIARLEAERASVLENAKALVRSVIRIFKRQRH